MVCSNPGGDDDSHVFEAQNIYPGTVAPSHMTAGDINQCVIVSLSFYTACTFIGITQMIVMAALAPLLSLDVSSGDITSIA